MASLTIRGWLTLSSPAQFNDAVAIVALDAVTYIDAESTRVAEVVIKPLRDVHAQIPFALSVDVDALHPSSLYTLSAEIRALGKDALSPGDFLGTSAHPWSPASDLEANISLQRI